MKDTLHPKVAVITRTKDRPVFLRRAMQSVLSQTFDDWVHVIVNDGGDSAIVETLAAFHADLYTGRIRIVHHAESQGMQNASNAGIAALDSEYVVIHDDDDSWEPDFLLTTTRYLDAEGRDSKVQGVITQTTQVTEELTVSGVFAQAARNPYCPVSHVGLKDMLERNLFPPIAFLYRRKVHETVGLFNQEFDVLGDHDFNLRFLRQFDIGVITDSHANYHWRHGSEGNTVTCARDVHRTMLNRMQNSYYRELLEDPKTAVGDLSGIETPPPDSPIRIPFRKRMDEPPAPARMPDFPAEYEFEVLSLDVFDTVLRRRCQSPRDIFSLLQDLAYKEMQLRHVPVAIARAAAESMARRMSGKEISLEQIYDAMASICRLSSVEAGRLMALELELEKRLLYAVPEWVRMYDNCRSGGKRVIFVSDMYLPSRFISEILENN